ncbi:MAG TPA: multicopper oxidase family protein [Actinomycetota bacterium]|nr:multicopper oxidase family protein [Actinomycetota bacterium]
MKQSDLFSTETTGLPQATRPIDIRLKEGDRLDLHIGSVRKMVGDDEVRMLAYNGSIPGPTLIVDQDSKITVDVNNEGDVDATVHWHGLRLENRYDGVPGDTQAPIEVGGTYTCRVHFPDAGFYWYHPHIREDYAQDMGLSGTIVVRPTDPSYWPAVDRELTITLDDVLIEDGKMAPFRRSGPTFTAMGRFGNVMLINGETEFSDKAAAGEVVRLNLVNTANTRIFNFGLRGARMKLVGGDSGRYEREVFVDEVMLSPSERAIVDVLFETEGQVLLGHRTPEHIYELGSFIVDGTLQSSAAAAFPELRVDPDLAEERRSIATDFAREPDKTLSFTSEMPLLYGRGAAAATSYVCPMHPEVTDTKESSCPKCGMKLIPAAAAPAVTSYVCPMHPEVTDTKESSCPKCGMKLIPAASVAPAASHDYDHGHGDTGDGLEWEDLMPDINRQTDLSNMIWKLVDKETGAVNHEISWDFKLDERVKIRLVNEMEGSDHPMHHPFHVHGAGRFLILSRDGRPEDNLVWKDTVLLRAGEAVDILLHLTNPGLWMAHCHIAEHTESGMMFSFRVEP